MKKNRKRKIVRRKRERRNTKGIKSALKSNIIMSPEIVREIRDRDIKAFIPVRACDLIWRDA